MRGRCGVGAVTPQVCLAERSRLLASTPTSWTQFPALAPAFSQKSREWPIQGHTARVDLQPMRGLEREGEANRHRRLLDEAQAIAHVGSWEWDIASGRLSWTDEHYRIFGLDPSTFTPTIENGLACVHEDDLPRMQSLLETTIEVGQPYSLVARIRRPDGETRWIESVGVPSIVDGVVVSLIGTVLDVTARELSQASLRESEARYKMIVETAREAIWVVDVDGITIFANEQLAVMLGRPQEELIGESVFAFLDDEGRAIAAENFAGLRQGDAKRFDFRLSRPDGTEVWTLLSSAPIRDSDGNYAGALAMLTDITERHQAEIDLHESRARLAEAQRLALLGNWAYDVKSRVVVCSEELFLVIGVEPDQGTASFERFMLLVHPDDRVRAASFLTRVQTDFMALSDELRIITPKGEERWLALRATPVVDATGQVTEMRGTMQEITERKASEQQLVHFALHDMLTGLPNRSLFNDRLQHALARRETPVAVILLDLDGFKAINDGLGHPAGDALLVAVADRLSGALRPSDTVARFGGDEFTILVEGAGEPEAQATAERLLKALVMPLAVEGRKVIAQASIGVALGSGESPRAEQLLRDADAAMYQAKRTGGGRYVFFDATLHATVGERMALECDLRSVELGAEMTLSYQPLVDLRDGHVTGFEALLRWNHPVRGAIAPADFIPIAEQTGAIVPIGRWVIEQACRQCRLWQQRYPTAVGLAMNVNVSARQLADHDIVYDVARALDSSGLDPALLTLEITETMSMADEDKVGETLRQLKGLGVRISVDDFGTGYSSLDHLDRFPIDELKIDRSLVARLGDDADDPGVALAVIRLARSLHLDIVAEGIERADQLAELRDARCTRGQGYYLGRPLDVASVEDLLEGLPRSVLPRELVRAVLVVDDDDEVRHSTGRVLARAGYEVVEAATGQEAILAVRTRCLDAVVLDVELPDINGLEVCKQIKELSQDDLPVLYLSGAAVTVDDRVRGLNVADGYLIKPAAPAELVATLGSLLRTWRRGGPGVARELPRVDLLPKPPVLPSSSRRGRMQLPTSQATAVR